MQILTLLTFILGSIFIFLGSLLVGKWRMRLVGRIEWMRIPDNDTVSKYLGYNFIVLGILGFIAGFFEFFFPRTHVYMFLAYAAVIIPIMGIRMRSGMKSLKLG